MQKLIYLVFTLVVAIGMASCIEDGYVTDASAQPEFSVDTLDMGLFFTEDVTPTFSFVVYNRHDKLLNISSISLRGELPEGIFRLNVDGFSGKQFSNIDIRPNDSIFVFVEATMPLVGTNVAENFTEHLDFVTNGTTRSVVLASRGQDVRRLRGRVIDADTRFTAEYPYRIFDSLVVAKDVTLTLDPGVKLYFHDGGTLKVDGTLVTLGTPEALVEMSGDRTDNVVGQIPFDLMSNQWDGVYFSPSSKGSSLSHTVIRNMRRGVTIDSVAPAEVPALYMLNCRLRNSGGVVMQSWYSDVTAVGCEFADASMGVLYLHGGNIVMNHCTVSNNYLFTAVGGPAITFGHFNADTAGETGLPLMKADISNTIVYGIGNDLSHGDFSGSDVTLRSCLLKSAGEDDDNFIRCLWDTDPLFRTIREEYIFDYRLLPDSPALGAADPSLTRPDAATDLYGLPRGSAPAMGAYVYCDPTE